LNAIPTAVIPSAGCSCAIFKTRFTFELLRERYFVLPDFAAVSACVLLAVAKKWTFIFMETQDASTEFLFKLWPWLEANKTKLIGGAVIVLMAAGIYSLVSWQREQKEITAGQAFSQLVLSTSANLNVSQRADAFAQLAVKYSGTEAGARAQLQSAATLFESGNYADAQAQFQKFLDAKSTGPLAATASLGLAASLEAQDKLDLATAAYQKVAANFAGSTADLTAEFSLGRLAEQQGKLAEAETYYENASRAGRAGGSLAEEAYGRAYEIKAKLAATQKNSAATNAIQLLK
jgi:predicted negative regulator of RcsB-dependent stress response